MKNNLFLRQNLFVLTAVGLSWIVGSWLFREFIELWTLSTIFLLFYVPLAYVKFNRLKEARQSNLLDNTIRATLLIFALLCLLPLPHILWYNLYYIPSISFWYHPESSLAQIVAGGLFRDISYNLGYFLVAGLLYCALRLGKQKELIIQSS